MTPTEIHSTYKKILTYLTEGRLKNAFETTAELNAELQSPAHAQNLENMVNSCSISWMAWTIRSVNPFTTN